MTQEFRERLTKEFQAPDYRIIPPGNEQFGVRKLGVSKEPLSLEEISEIAKRTLKRVKTIRILETDAELIQGLGRGDVLIIPGHQSSTSHAIGITDLDIGGARIFFSTSWHSNYHMTKKQIERYIDFARAYFQTFE